MTDADSHLPEDIAQEKSVSRRLAHEYRGAAFGGIRQFRALRQQAPGIIAEFVLAVVISVLTVAYLFRDIKFGGVLHELANTLKIIVVIVVCFWVAGRIWRLIGLANRNRCRYVVGNMWNLALGGLLIASFVIKMFYPEVVETP